MSPTIYNNLKYLVANEEDKQWGLVINTVGHQRVCAHEKYPLEKHPHRYLFSSNGRRILDEYQLVYIVNGRGTFESNSHNSITIGKGTLLMLFPGEWHSYYPTKEVGWDEYWIGFEGINIDNRVLSGFFCCKNPLFDIGINEAIVRLYQQAIEAASEQRAGFQIVLAGIVNHLLGLIYAINKNNTLGNSNLTEKIQEAKVVMQENVYKKVSPKEVCQIIGVGYSWFRKAFKEYTGFSPAQYFLEIKIAKSKELLTNTEQLVKHIAYDLSFDNCDYFCTVFKRKTTMSPHQYRELTQQKREK